ncbi:fibulin-1-like [Gambusia affinis]|uniref:fibulin-1-like n=1 Tax=Gambusia affinis TaxID=33528 RepID=UPI001CDBA0EA|nr:fibulin-1-like [Gambusia affinis]XP_043964220.1 fibulin-1-like [Gambusia affinis]
MAREMVVLFSLYGLLMGIESKFTSVHECCEAGRAIALRKQDCAALPRFSSHICSIAKEHCCRALARKRACDTGVKVARGHGVCERPLFTGSDWETQISQSCCDCCTLGLKTDSMGFSCDFQELQLDKQCSNAAKACCEKPKDIAPSAGGQEELKVSISRPPDQPNACRELNCSQLCVGDGRCVCNDGFRLQRDGATCEDINECLADSHDCSAEQVCINTDGSFRCQLSCHPGFTITDGVICKDIDECALGSHNCGADYVCVNTPGSFYCDLKVACRDGFTRDASGNCVDIDECLLLTDPCQPGQRCVNAVGSFVCLGNAAVCPQGYHPTADGTRCDDVDECLVTSVCGSHACVNLDGSYRCECRAGYRLSNATGVCEDLNECKHYSRRLCGHICENTEGSYQCRCISGFRLAPDGRTCEDINECLTGRHSCASGQVCLNTEGSFHCQRETACNTGYKLMGSSCQDIDECALGRHDCGANSVCVNTAGSFFCQQKPACRDGFTLDAAGGCTDIDECSAHTSPCQPSQACVNTVGSHSCHTNAVTCPRGFHLSVNGTRCEDVNECMVGSKCAKHVCVNLEGLYRCQCRSGYMFNAVTKLCEDINECTHHPGRLCAHKCVNTEGSYRCSCATGFKLADGGRDCEDINECEDKPCSQECTNVYGSYQCYCHRGYQLNDVDGTTCEDIDECTLPNVCSYLCVNTPGDFNCTCPTSGYTLSYDGRTCQDIDECAAGTHSCSAKEACFNIQGGFRCLFFECPPNFRRAGKGSAGDASAVVRCVKACREHDGDCVRDPVHVITSTALSLPTLQRLKEPEEIVLLRTSAAAKQDLLPDEPDVLFDISADDELLSFDVVKRAQNGMVVGIIRQIKPVLGPKELILEVSMKYVQSGVVSQQNIVLIRVFISKFWF